MALLTGKTTVVYGGGGVVGSAVAEAFAREGATVGLAGRTQTSLDVTVKAIREAGGTAEAARVDALDPAAVEGHLDDVCARHGTVDVALDAMLDDRHDFGIPLADLDIEAFLSPVDAHLRRTFAVITAAARRMKEQADGVVLTLSSSVARMYSAGSGGFLTACTAIEAFTAQLAVEVGPYGIRAVCLRPDGMPESARRGSHAGEVWRRAVERAGMSMDDYLADPGSDAPLPYPLTPEDVAETATFLASGRARGITATTANLSCGLVVG